MDSISWSNPPVFTVGQILTAAQQNTISNDLVALGPGGWYRKTTANAVNSTVSATDLLNGEITLAAGLLGLNGLCRLTAWGDWLQNSGGAAAPPRFQLALGGATLFDTGSVGAVTSSGASRAGWRLVAEIINTGAANAQAAIMQLQVSFATGGSAGAAAFTTGNGLYATVYSGAATDFVQGVASNIAAVNTAVACALALNVINGSASASYETKLLGAVVEAT